MSKIHETENNSNEAPPIEPNNNYNKYFLICPVCSWPLEIISIDKENNELEFRCIKYNHINTKISLTKYFLITASNKMSIKFYQSEFQDKCKYHKNKYNECFCVSCNQHLCDECSNGGNHWSHIKIIKNEFTPDKRGLNAINDIIKNNKKKLKYLNEAKEKKVKELNKKLEKTESEIKKRLNNKINLNKEKNIENLENNKKEFIAKITEIKKKYEEEIKEAKYNYIKINNEINNELIFKNKQLEIKYNLIIKRKKILCENMINQLQHNIEIEKIESLIKLDESVYNTYKLYNNNYINSINVNNLLFNYFKNKSYNELMKKKFGKDYNDLKKI